MKIEIIQGSFPESMKYCKKKCGDTVFFELSYMDSFDSAVTEFNKFIKETAFSDVVGERIKKTVAVDLSQWNDDWRYNRYLEDFLYMLADMNEGMSFIFISEREMNRGLLERIKELGLFELTLKALPGMVKKKEAVRIGFASSLI